MDKDHQTIDQTLQQSSDPRITLSVTEFNPIPFLRSISKDVDAMKQIVQFLVCSLIN